MPMQKDDIERIMNQARMLAVGASDAGIKAKTYEVIREFFMDSLSWREDISFQAAANVQQYLLVPQYGGQIFALFAVWDGNNFPIAAFLGDYQDGDDYEALNIVYPITSTPPTQWTARFYKTIVLPTNKDDIPLAPKWLASKYAGVIIDGIVGNLKMEKGKSYSDPQGATYHLKRFRTGIQNAKVSADHARIRGGQSWSYPNNYRTNSQQAGLVTAWPGIGYGE